MDNNNLRREAEAFLNSLYGKFGVEDFPEDVDALEVLLKAQRREEVEAIREGIKAMKYHYLVEHHLNTWNDAFAHWLSHRKKEWE